MSHSLGLDKDLWRIFQKINRFLRDFWAVLQHSFHFFKHFWRISVDHFRLWSIFFPASTILNDPQRSSRIFKKHYWPLSNLFDASTSTKWNMKDVTTMLSQPPGSSTILSDPQRSSRIFFKKTSLVSFEPLSRLYFQHERHNLGSFKILQDPPWSCRIPPWRDRPLKPLLTALRPHRSPEQRPHILQPQRKAPMGQEAEAGPTRYWGRSHDALTMPGHLQRREGVPLNGSMDPCFTLGVSVGPTTQLFPPPLLEQKSQRWRR